MHENGTLASDPPHRDGHRNRRRPQGATSTPHARARARRQPEGKRAPSVCSNLVRHCSAPSSSMRLNTSPSRRTAKKSSASDGLPTKVGCPPRPMQTSLSQNSVTFAKVWLTMTMVIPSSAR